MKICRFEFSPTKAQEPTFVQWLGTCRYVNNLALDTKIHAHPYGLRLSKFDLMKQLPDRRTAPYRKSQTDDGVIKTATISGQTDAR